VGLRGAVAALTVALATAPQPLHVLFVGNSLTSTNDLPAMVAAIGERSGRPIVVETRAPGGYALEDHWNLTDLRERLAKGGYDWVVMQQGPSSLPESGVNLHEWAATLADAVRAGGGRPAVLTVWPEWYRRGVFDSVIGNYRRAARDSHSLSIPAGVVWKTLLAQKVPLYGPDAFHPSRTGTYVTALTVYAAITRTVPAMPAKYARAIRAALKISARSSN
jgi:hypothetical protein